MVDLGTLDNSISYAWAVNDNGHVVGDNRFAPVIFEAHAFLWTPTGGMVDLGTLGGNRSSSSARDINEHGQIVGETTTTNPSFADRAFVWTAAQGMIELPPLPGYTISRAFAINNSGQIVGVSVGRGCSTPCSGDDRATMWVVPPQDDDTPPTLVLPAMIVVNATSPAGATVTYSVSATDDEDPNPFLVCSPSSGSVFPLLATTVTCTATDAAGNSATGTFDVIVKDAPQQLADTIALLASYNLTRLGTSLTDKLRLASGFIPIGDSSEACGVLTGFLNQVDAQTGKALTVVQATELTVRVIRIRGVVGCGPTSRS